MFISLSKNGLPVRNFLTKESSLSYSFIRQADVQNAAGTLAVNLCPPQVFSFQLTFFF